MSKVIRGKGGDEPRQPVNAPNTLRTKTTAKVIFVPSVGETGGLYDQANPLKSVLFDSTPVQNADGSYNFQNVKVSERYGTATQTYVSGFPSASTSFAIGTKVTTAAPVVHDTLVSGIDAVRVTIRFPALYEQKSNGDTVGSTVNFRIERRLGTSGAWSLVYNVTQSDKTPGAADLDWLVDAPGAGRWQVRVVRVTPDNTSLTTANDIYFQTATNIVDVKLAYPGVAYLALVASADTTGADFPRVAFDYNGIKLPVPSNYTVSTRTYTGVWDGTFQVTKQVHDNPAWFLYEVLTNDKWGMGLDPADIDQYSFYSAAQYNDQLVPDGLGGQEPRYTMNYQFMMEEQAWDFVQNVAASFGAVVYTSGNRVMLVQDRPTSRTRLITNSNVVDGEFEYSSSQGRSRYTAAIAYYNDPNQGWLSVPAYYEDSAAITRYGYNKTEVAALGATTYGQAYRYAKWFVETSISNTDVVTFRVGMSEATFQPGEVVDIMDDTYAEVIQEAKLVSKTSSSITLDKAITVSSGNTFDIVASDGTTIITRTITSTGSLSTINFSGADFTAVAGADVIITGAVAPRKFKVTTVRESAPFVWSISAVQYDPNKYGRVDGTFTTPPQVYQSPVSFTVVSPVTGITFEEESYTTPEGVAKRWLKVRWSPPANQFITGYQVFWTLDNGQATSAGVLNQPYFRLPADVSGTYTVTITAINARGTRSSPASGSAVVNLEAPVGAAALSPVTSLFIRGTSGGTFTGRDAVITWADTQVNGASVVAGYEVRVKRADTSALLRTEFVPVNEAKQYEYTYAKNMADGGPRRSVIFDVYVKDTFGRYSAVTSLTASNPTPAAPAVVVDAGYGMLFVRVNEAGSTEADIEGCKVWVSTTNGFTPNDATNLVSYGADRIYSQAATAGTTYYVKAAFYDSFDRTTANLSISAQQSTTPVTFTPADPNEYTFSGITFKANDPSTNRVSWTAGTAIKTSGTSSGSSWAISSGNALWSSGTLYLYYVEGGSTILSTTSLATAVGTDHVILATYKGSLLLSQGDGDFFVDGGNIYAQTIGASQLVVGTAVITDTAQIANAIITGAKIGTATITQGNIANLAVGTAQIIDASITNAKIANLAVGTANIQDAAITNAKIGSLAVDTANIQALAVTTAKIDNLAVTTAKIANLAVGTAQIDNLAVTTAKIDNLAVSNAKIGNLAVDNGKIANLAVTTLKIGDQAVTVPIGANIPAGSIVYGQSNVEMGRVSITLDYVGGGGGVAVNVAIPARYASGNDTSGTAQVDLYRGSTLLRSFYYSDGTGVTTERYAGKSGYVNSTADNRPTVFVLFDEVAAGTHTYILKASCARTSGVSTCSFSWQVGGITLLGAKK